MPEDRPALDQVDICARRGTDAEPDCGCSLPSCTPAVAAAAAAAAASAPVSRNRGTWPKGKPSGSCSSDSGSVIVTSWYGTPRTANASRTTSAAPRDSKLKSSGIGSPPPPPPLGQAGGGSLGEQASKSSMFENALAMLIEVSPPAATSCTLAHIQIHTCAAARA